MQCHDVASMLRRRCTDVMYLLGYVGCSVIKCTLLSDPLCHLCMFMFYILYSINYCLTQIVSSGMWATYLKTQISLCFHILWSIFVVRVMKLCALGCPRLRESLRKLTYSNTNVYWKCYHQKKKNENFRIKKKSDIFHISAQNIDCGYLLEPPLWGGSNEYPQSMFLSRNKNNNVYPCKLQFYYIKKGV